MKACPEWLKDAVFYEVYPQSFFDSNADGIGDLPGIIEKLDYIKGLGCNAIWINPCFESPFEDAGYDITDYYKIAPRYGTNADMERLFKEAKKRGLRVLLDLVPGHMSIHSEMFQRSCEPEPNEFTKRFIWTDDAWEGSSHLNVIKGYCDRNGGYVTNFFYMQAALNYGFEEPEPGKTWQLPPSHPACMATKNMMMDVMRFWSEMGADGFRVDMASSLIKNDPNHTGTKRLWREVRTWYETQFPDNVLVSEWSDPEQAIDAGFHVDFLIQFNNTAYTALFRSEREGGHSFFSPDGKGDVTRFTSVLERILKTIEGRGYLSVPTGNHDILRISEGRSNAQLKVAYACIFTLPGIPFLYYGDEIGMRNNMAIHSKEGGYERTCARTPMQWSSGRSAGFSDVEEEALYLPIAPNRKALNVETQQQQEDSLLEFVRRCIALRHAHPALQSEGGYETLFARAGAYPYAYLRTSGSERYLVVLNPGPNAHELVLQRAEGQPRALLAHGCRAQKGAEGCAVWVEAESYGIFCLD